MAGVKRWCLASGGALCVAVLVGCSAGSEDIGSDTIDVSTTAVVGDTEATSGEFSDQEPKSVAELAEEIIDTEVAALLGEPIAADCETPLDSDPGTPFLCTAESSEGLVKIEATPVGESVSVMTTNVIAYSVLEQQMQTITDRFDGECAPGFAVFSDFTTSIEIYCDLIDPDTGATTTGIFIFEGDPVKLIQTRIEQIEGEE